MSRVGIADLKAHLSEHLRKVLGERGALKDLRSSEGLASRFAESETPAQGG
jgi:hypothetical protein